MPSMLSYNRRLPSGHFTCYLNRTYHVLTTPDTQLLDNSPGNPYPALNCLFQHKGAQA